MIGSNTSHTCGISHNTTPYSWSHWCVTILGTSCTTLTSFHQGQVLGLLVSDQFQLPPCFLNSRGCHFKQLPLYKFPIQVNHNSWWNHTFSNTINCEHPKSNLYLEQSFMCVFWIILHRLPDNQSFSFNSWIRRMISQPQEGLKGQGTSCNFARN